MENIIYNELIARGYSVDVGIVEAYEKDDSGKRRKIAYEINFVTLRLGVAVTPYTCFADTSCSTSMALSDAPC